MTWLAVAAMAVTLLGFSALVLADQQKTRRARREADARAAAEVVARAEGIVHQRYRAGAAARRGQFRRQEIR